MAVLALALRRDPLDVLASLAREPGAFLLDVPDPERPVTLLGCAPRAELCITADGAGWTRAGEAIEQFVRETAVAEPGLPFPLGGGIVGYLAYELGAGRGVPDVPLAVLRRYDPLVVYDRLRAQYTLVASDAEAARAPWLERLGAPLAEHDEARAADALLPLMPAEGYRAAVRRILEYLAAGDAYQVNLTQPFTAPSAVPPAILYRRLARRHPMPYGAYLDLGGATLLMNSPELFLRRRGRRLETRPIKGTRPRGANAGADAALVSELGRDPKERAEHVMIVDLERNDLGRVCTTGSVVVEDYARIESHPTLHHLVSVIAGELRPDVGLAALLDATFPGGSITGAPKRRAMEIIAELEPWARGAYTGALGLFDPRGDLELGLAIRTAVVAGGAVRYHAGGGIVADSDPERELAEAWLKTAALRLALGEPVGPELECSSG
jgi:para-aminobenzoate synthetase component 1